LQAKIAQLKALRHERQAAQSFGYPLLKAAETGPTSILIRFEIAWDKLLDFKMDA
jgi:hypothetical protein